MYRAKACITFLFIMFLLIALLPHQMFADVSYKRIYGSDRIETALKVCEKGWPVQAQNIIVAPADQPNMVDALAAAPLAGEKNAPILLTYKNSLDSRVKAKIIALKANKVYVIGAISDSVLSQIASISGINVVALKGRDRWETTKQINNQLTNPTGTILVGYNQLADALSVSSYAAAKRLAIILADGDGNVPEGQTILGSSIIVVGDIGKNISTAVRINGSDRFGRNTNQFTYLSYFYDKVYIANGDDRHLVDALVIAPLAARDNAPIILAESNAIRAAGVVNTFMSANSEVYALGGPTVVSDSNTRLLYPLIPDVRVNNLEGLNLSSFEITYSADVDKTSAENPKNYLIDGTTLDNGLIIGRPLLQEDKRTVLIMLFQPVQYDRTLSVEVKGNSVLTESKDQTVLAFKGNVSLIDSTSPIVTKITAQNKNQITVYFSEVLRLPVKEDCEKWTLGFMTLKDFGLESIETPDSVVEYGNKVVLKLTGNISVGKLKMEIQSGTINGQLSDAANNTLIKQEVEFTASF